jgi:hypothetical protein
MKPNKDRFILDCHQYGLELGYELDADDLEEIYATSYEGETVEHAVNDYLDAYER